MTVSALRLGLDPENPVPENYRDGPNAEYQYTDNRAH